MDKTTTTSFEVREQYAFFNLTTKSSNGVAFTKLSMFNKGREFNLITGHDDGCSKALWFDSPYHMENDDSNDCYRNSRIFRSYTKPESWRGKFLGMRIFVMMISTSSMREKCCVVIFTHFESVGLFSNGRIFKDCSNLRRVSDTSDRENFKCA